MTGSSAGSEPLSSAPAQSGVLAGVYDVDKSFAGVRAVHGATLEIGAGEVHCLIGENGAGKSTIVKMLSGVYAPDRGQVRLLGEPVELRSPNDALDVGVNTIYQEHTLVPEMTVAENLALGAEPGRALGLLRDRRLLKRRAAELLEELNIDGISPTDRTGDLGIARQQLIEIAKAVWREGERVVIMDEPTAPLTLDEVEHLFSLIRRLRERSLGILYITHRLGELAEIGDVVTVMRDGETVHRSEIGALDEEQLIELMVGRKLDGIYPQRTTAPGRTMLEIHPTKAEDDEGLTVREGEIVALFGLVGAGRTELVRCAIGADPTRGQRLLVDGRERAAGSPRRALQLGIGLVPEDRKAQGIVPEMSVASNIALSSLGQVSRGSLVSNRGVHRLARGYADRMRIRTPSLRQPIMYLSGGNQQKCVIARALAAAPSVIILDEPTRGIDVGARAEIYELMNELCGDGRAILMITSDLPEALGMADRIYVMREGRLTGHMNAIEATQEAIMARAVVTSSANAKGAAA